MINVLKNGQEVENPAALKMGQNITNAVFGLVALLPLFGIDISLTNEQLLAIASVVGTINLFITTASTKKIGL